MRACCEIESGDVRDLRFVWMSCSDIGGGSSPTSSAPSTRERLDWVSESGAMAWRGMTWLHLATSTDSDVFIHVKGLATVPRIREIDQLRCGTGAIRLAMGNSGSGPRHSILSRCVLRAVRLVRKLQRLYGSISKRVISGVC